MQNNEEHQNEVGRKPTADDIAGEYASVRRSAIWGKPAERPEGAERQLALLRLAEVDPDPNQPRRFFGQKGLEELKASIESRGQLTPAFVRPHPEAEGRYMLIAGERRYRVLKDLGHETILAIVLPVSEQEAREIALIDNLQRADLSAFEEAAGYQRLIEEFQFTQEEVAQKVGKDQTVISNTLTINKLPKNIKEDEWAQQASKSVLLELARVNDTKKLRSLWAEVKKDIKAGNPVSVRHIRQKRTDQERPASPPPAERVMVTGRHFAKQLADLTPEVLAASPEQQETLRAIRQRLDELFAGLEQASAAPEERGEEEALA
jgi:ParB/RepB/Spo0J family partition protein